MFSLAQLYTKPWFNKLPFIQKELVSQSYYFLEDKNFDQSTFYDYSFIVMPAAKAYEGFLKDLFYKQKLITQERYKGNHFRVGKALNPELAHQHPDGFERLFDDMCRIYSPEIADLLWEAWKQSRNQIFHYFENGQQTINLYEAKRRLNLICQAIEKVSEFKK
ncbi:hypothetical protein COX08_03545 [Candidatus Beckwithbacteria bacterium CG23_combo_of_CG06-09_8_20_14_all_34_8]|uniref:Bacterial toxin RNase RnlA/LsoA DBD domain-containing protein n=1 Tax=Candidatus Beckwithbacteria bacterium CG23_combo_of_CG06-09_8_20_14_all_34_8 TaxID=1974497 RepID=A0A2H0B7R2_9BACT|nr:MAG: hypothetical protein COX08_03545 [Candidatus Beckwithbacteria bacterium CG23_combo_of_CG06-09_8_20_14_all_34_8]